MDSLDKYIPSLVAFQPRLLEVFFTPRRVVKIHLSFLLADSFDVCFISIIMHAIQSVVLRRPRFRIIPENVLFLVRFLHLSAYWKFALIYKVVQI